MQPVTSDWTDTLLYFVPALLVLMGMFLLVKRFTDVQLSMIKKLMERDLQLRTAQDRASKLQDSLPLKLQAYERLILFLERITPDNLLVRVHQSGMSAQLLHLEMLTTIRAEFEHNLSQQLYVSDEAWQLVCNAKDAIAKSIDMAYRTTGAGASGVQLSAALFEVRRDQEVMPGQAVILFLKQEAQRLIS